MRWNTPQISPTIWVELKSKGKKPTKVQQLRIAQLRQMGHNVAVVDSKDQVDTLLQAVDFVKDL